MAVKRINPLEQHVEKIVLGVAGASLLGILAWQFVGPRPTVTVEKDAVPMDLAYGRVQQAANKLRADMTSENPPLPAAPKDGGLLAEFKSKYQGPLLPADLRVVRGFGGSGTGPAVVENNGGTSADGPVHVPAVPAPGEVVAHAFMAIVDKGEAEGVPELTKRLPKAEPFDIPAVSIQASLDGTALKGAFEVDPDGQGPIRAVPRNWWETSTAVLRVEVTREEQQPDGSWSGSTVLPTLPGRYDLSDRLKAGIRPGEQALQTVTDAITHEEQILRPDWYARPTLGGLEIGEEWRQPVLAAAGGDEGSRTVAMIRAELADKERGLRNQEESLRQAQNPARSTGQGATGTGGGGRTGRTPPVGQGGKTTNTVDQGRVKQLESLIAKQKDRIKELQDELAKKGVTSKPTAAAAPTGDRLASELFSSSNVQVWAHDIDVKRGKTYRYKARLVVTNPLFARGGLPESQQELTRQFTLAGAESAWSAPVTVDEEMPFFITSVQDRDQSQGAGIGRGARAVAEMFVFNWGYWRKASVPVEPGDTLVGNATVPDMEKLAAELAKLAAGPGHEQPGGPGAGRGAQPAGPSGQGGKDEGKDKKGEKKPPSLAELSKKVVVSRDVLMLDAAQALEGSSARGMQAYLRDTTGRLIVRSPEAERSRAEYRRLAASAKAGEDLFSAKFEPAKPDAAIKRPREDTPPPPPPPGRGGGSTGGG
jgi:hypothetical protein